jgi:predicted GNAT family N-acyltransferase
MPEVVVNEVSWHEAQHVLSEIRTQVFVIEQQVPESLEWDGFDAGAVHLLAMSKAGVAVGCARLLPQGRIERMAVLKANRGHGIGLALLQAAIVSCRTRGWHDITLSAQVHALGFYAQAGFIVCSEEYLDAGISHRDMKLSLSI